eukprot:3961384-Amphidinium_carterae.1
MPLASNLRLSISHAQGNAAHNKAQRFQVKSDEPCMVNHANGWWEGAAHKAHEPKASPHHSVNSGIPWLEFFLLVSY